MNDAVVDGKKGRLWEIDPEDNRRGSGSHVVMDSNVLFAGGEKFRGTVAMLEFDVLPAKLICNKIYNLYMNNLMPEYA